MTSTGLYRGSLASAPHEFILGGKMPLKKGKSKKVIEQNTVYALDLRLKKDVPVERALSGLVDYIKSVVGSPSFGKLETFYRSIDDDFYRLRAIWRS